VFAVQDEIARNIAEALRVTLSPQEQEALAAKPTENLQAYDLYLRGRSYARRHTRQDLEFALQMFENAVSLDPEFALRPRGDLERGAPSITTTTSARKGWLDRFARRFEKGDRTPAPSLPEVKVAQAWILYTQAQYEEAAHVAQEAVERKRDTEGAYYLDAAGAVRGRAATRRCRRWPDPALEASGTDYNVYVPIVNALGALGKKDALDKHAPARDPGAREPPEDRAGGRARAKRPRG